MTKQPERPRAVILDMDGTLAIITDRSPFDHNGVLKDRPNGPVIEVARALRDAGSQLVVVSGRKELARADTELWLTRHLGGDFDGPFMRAADDDRNDATVKREIYERDVRPNWDVWCVLDDRDSVVKMWRHIGLTCLQVAPGDF